MNKYQSLLLLFFINLSLAQNNSHNNVWTRFSITNEIHTKFKLEIEAQKRWQNNVTLQNSNNFFQEELMKSVRFWTHYKFNSKLNFSISPFAYFQHTAIITAESDMLKKKSYEIRYTAAADYKEKVLAKTYFIDRLALEYRDFKNNNNDNVIRLRNKIAFKHEFNKKWSLMAFDELFLNLNSSDKKHLFDHNRIGITGSFIPSEKIKIDFGYIRIERLPKNNLESMSENNFLIMIYYTFKN